MKQEQQSVSVLETEVGRRRVIQGMGVLGIGAFLGGLYLKEGGQVTPVSSESAKTTQLLNFKPISASTADRVRVPEGYKAQVLISWGDPLFEDAPDFDASGSSDASDQQAQFGDNNDGMSLFPIDENRAVLAVNNEYTNYGYLFAHDGKKLSSDDVEKSQAAVGISIFEIVRNGNVWELDKAGQLNRRITANTLMQITGPAAGHSLLQTEADPQGMWAYGTFANCSNGRTPWGTYLTCEENFNKNFGSKEKFKQTAQQQRYGLKSGKSKSQWEQHDSRFDLVDNPNEANRFGWIVEIDPMDPFSVPVKRTALGRFKHENAALTINDDGHAVVYMGDDSRAEHIYRFVSKNKVDEENPKNNRDLLAEGTLYVARFNGRVTALEGEGKWIELTHGKNGLTIENGFADQAEVLIYARMAATVVGATTMDRPEWLAVHPDNKTVYCTLTNNVERGMQKAQSPNAANPRVNNIYGQIIRWQPKSGDHTANKFEWDMYVLAGNPAEYTGARAGTANITADNMFNSPDGLGFDAAGRLWILTDGKDTNAGDYAGMGNNQMLCGDPNSGEIRRFMTGPVGCEVTGLTFSEDNKTLFVGIQHPGGGDRTEDGGFPSHFPDGSESKPRSSIMMITREDGESFAV